MIAAMILVLFTALQFCTGFGILHLLKIYLKPAFTISLSILIGIAVFSIVPFLLQLAFVPLTSFNIFSALLILCLAFNLNSKKHFLLLLREAKSIRFRLKLYEIPFLLLIVLMVFVSVWRCFYYPPTPRDLTSGPEVIAEYTVREKTMINSVFSIDLGTTNNQFKPPFITCLQIIYKYGGFPFGQVWLSVIFIFFLIFLYRVLVNRLHKAIAGLLLVMFIAIPEMYAYTFMVLFDYSNAVYFCLALYFLFEFFRVEQKGYLILSGLIMGVATYIRPETLILAFFIALAILFHYKRVNGKREKVILSLNYFLLPSIIIYLLSITAYINFYLPSQYKVETLLNKHLLDLNPLIHRFADLNIKILLNVDGIDYYGYFIFFFIAVLIISKIEKSEWNQTSRNWLFGVLVVYLGLPFIGYLFPLYDLDNSTKRGLFKIFPLMLLFLATNGFLISISRQITEWEEKKF